MDNTLVFVDAAFLSVLSKNFGGGKHLNVDISMFAKDISRRHNLFCKHIFYYTAPPFLSDKISKDEYVRKKGYDKFLSKISKDKGITVREGRCQKITNKDNEVKYTQKGVDALMVLDMALVSIKFKDVRKIILITSDTDFCPIIEELDKLNIETLLCIYYEKKRSGKFSVSHHLIDCCESVYYLTKKDFEKNRMKK